jgi:uncharacterized protein YeaO (DUF488 family)
VIATKAVYSPIEISKEGLRILVTRLQGRGLPASRYDVWMANLGPIERLLAAVRSQGISGGKFVRRYRAELQEGGSIDRRNPLITNHGQKFTLRPLQALVRRGTVRSMCHCVEDLPHCHRHILSKVLAGKI